GCRVPLRFDGLGPRPVRDNAPGDDCRDNHKSHPDRDQLPRVVPTVVHLDSPCLRLGPASCQIQPPHPGIGQPPLTYGASGIRARLAARRPLTSRASSSGKHGFIRYATAPAAIATSLSSVLRSWPVRTITGIAAVNASL